MAQGYVGPTLETIDGYRVTVRQSPTRGYYSDVWESARKPALASFEAGTYEEAREKACAWIRAQS